MQFQVPQFIETEDRVVGPFSLRQFFYVGAGGALSFMLFFSDAPRLLAVILSIFSLGLSIALAFIKINGRPLANLLLSALWFYWKPQSYVWKSENNLSKKEVVQEEGSLLERIISGLVLKSTWASLQTGSKPSPTVKREENELYQVFRRVSGGPQAARRVDYR